MAEVAGVKFPKTITVPGLKELELVGSGIREKRIAIINVKVYSVAFYAEHSSLSGPLAAFKGVQEGKLKKDSSFFKALGDAAVEKLISIVLVRDLKYDQFVGRLSETLEPKLKALQAGPEVLKEFEASFSGVEFKDRTRIYLGLTSSALHLSVVTPGNETAENGVPAGAHTTMVASPLLVAALNEVYLGNDAPSSSLKDSIASTASKTILV